MKDELKKLTIYDWAKGEDIAWEVATAWAEEAKKNGWVKFGDDDFYDEGELASSIVGWWREKKGVPETRGRLPNRMNKAGTALIKTHKAGDKVSPELFK